MRDLNYGLKKLVQDSREGSFATRTARHRILQQTANTLHELGYRKLKPEGIKPKHIDVLIQHWKSQTLSSGTIKNRLAHLRWWAKSVNKPAIIARDNNHYGIERRVYVTGQDKSKQIDNEKLNQIKDPMVRMSLQLQEAFGLRREEAIKFSPCYADRGDHLVLKASWTKGGKSRTIPIRTQEQRELLAKARQLAGRGSLIPANKNYYQQLRTYERNTAKVGMNRNHGLRHCYAQSRYRQITGWCCPAKGGPKRDVLSPQQRKLDRKARQTLSYELGHERVTIAAVYLG